MKSFTSLLVCLLAAAAFCGWASPAAASVFLPKTMAVTTTAQGGSYFSGSSSLLDARNKDLRRALRQQGFSRRISSARTAMAIPGYGLAEQVLVGGFGNFLSIVRVIMLLWANDMLHAVSFVHAIMSSNMLAFVS
jgi:hypothetical protein